MKHKVLLSLLALGLFFNSNAKIQIKSANGWLESSYIEWSNDPQFDNYHVYCRSTNESYSKLDDELIRNYGSYGRADAIGLAEGNYQFKIVPVKNKTEIPEESTESEWITVKPHDRSGFAFKGTSTPGAYQSNGTLKKNAVILYITDSNKDNISCNITTSSKGATTSCKGIIEILKAIKKGYETRPFSIRILGKITNSGSISSDSEFKGDLIIDLGKSLSCPITIEGIGNDATAFGWGIRLKNANYCEVRNLGFLYCNSDEGDNVGLQQDNNYIWVHHNDMFYGQPGSDKDQVKGDGALDCKKSNYVTFSYNHFWDNGKCNLLGLSEGIFSYQANALYITYHHNWYDHSDSRHPRCRYYNAHVYNNYYDGNSKYGAGSTLGSSVFMQNNYFRNCKYPMLTSMQGSDLYASGSQRNKDNATFSSEDGGVIKACGNIMTGNYYFIPYGAVNIYTAGNSESASIRGINTSKDYDAYVVTDPSITISQGITSYQGSHYYSNFDTNKSVMPSTKVDNTEDVPSIIQGEYGAGRLQHGDFQWTFSESDDDNHDVDNKLSSAIANYTNKMVDLYTEPSNSAEENREDMGGNDEEQNPKEEDNTNIETNGSMICHFTGRVPSNTSFYQFSSCNYSNSKGTATVNGTIYTDCLKMESATEFSFTSSNTGTLTIVFASGETPSLKIDGIDITNMDNAKITDNVLTISNLKAGKHSITKVNSVNVFYIVLSYNESTNLLLLHSTDQLEGPFYNLFGQPVHRDALQSGRVYISDGKRFIIR